MMTRRARFQNGSIRKVNRAKVRATSSRSRDSDHSPPLLRLAQPSLREEGGRFSVSETDGAILGNKNHSCSCPGATFAMRIEKGL
jgi:hypothetical protein